MPSAVRGRERATDKGVPMQRLRLLALVVGLSAVAAAAALALGGGATATGAKGRQAQAWWSPPPDVRAMLRDLGPEPGALRPRARRLRHAPHALQPGRSGARHRRRARLDQGASSTRSPRTSGGRMSVELQSYVQAAGEPYPVPTRITNVVATLHGTDPAAADRVYVVGAHYDSRVTDVLDATSDAPGANDDASGTSAVLELARVMARIRARRRSCSSPSRGRSRACTAPPTSPSWRSGTAGTSRAS